MSENIYSKKQNVIHTFVSRNGNFSVKNRVDRVEWLKSHDKSEQSHKKSVLSSVLAEIDDTVSSEFLHFRVSPRVKAAYMFLSRKERKMIKEILKKTILEMALGKSEDSQNLNLSIKIEVENKLKVEDDLVSLKRENELLKKEIKLLKEEIKILKQREKRILEHKQYYVNKVKEIKKELLEIVQELSVVRNVQYLNIVALRTRLLQIIK